MAQEIDVEIYRLIEEARQRAARVLLDHQPDLHKIAGILMEHETIDREQFERLLQGEPEHNVILDDLQPLQLPQGYVKPGVAVNHASAIRYPFVGIQVTLFAPDAAIVARKSTSPNPSEQAPKKKRGRRKLVDPAGRGRGRRSRSRPAPTPTGQPPARARARQPPGRTPG